MTTSTPMREVTTTGYGRALGDVRTPDWLAALRVKGADQPGSEGPNIAEVCYSGDPFATLTLQASVRAEVPPVVTPCRGRLILGA